MSECNETTKDYLSRDLIVKRAEEKWNSKAPSERIRSSHKYKHIFEKLNLPSVDWNNEFSKLSKSQTNILIKGELIRTYDSMPNREKTKIKNQFGLSTFSSKWFRLSPSDKKILLNSILK
jgi:hypothetical protein